MVEGSPPCVTFEDRRMAFVPCSFRECLGREMVVGIRGTVDCVSTSRSFCLQETYQDLLESWES